MTPEALAPETVAPETLGPETATDVRRGRPRRPEADRAILAAVVDLLAEHGYRGVTMEGVAQTAGVGKATVYRRWPSKSAMVVDAIRACADESCPIPDTGATRDDLVLFLAGLADALRSSDAGRTLPALVFELAREPELALAFREGFLAQRRSLLLDALRRGIQRGELRPDLDLDVVADALAGVLHLRLLVTGAPIEDDLPGRVVDLLWGGMAAGPSGTGG